jgi:hypothetical protein
MNWSGAVMALSFVSSGDLCKADTITTSTVLIGGKAFSKSDAERNMVDELDSHVLRVKYSRLESVKCEGLSLQKVQDGTKKCPIAFQASSCAFHRDEEIEGTENNRGLWRGEWS